VRKAVIGLTGGIGSGKSAAANEFARLGATLVDTDVIAHELTAKGGLALPRIREMFGDQAIAPDGAMDRAWMRQTAFADPAARKKLEGVLHPMIRAESSRRIAAALGSNEVPYVVHVVPLLIESPDYRSRVDRVLVVDAPEETQVARVRARSGLDEEQIHAVIRAQAPRAERLAAADDVIDNSGDLASLRQQVAALHEKYARLGKA
jgi:dephospho-CoA kinase